MPKKTLKDKLQSAKKTTSRSTAKSSTTAKAKAVSGDADAKRQAREAQESEQRAYVAKNYLDGDMTLGAVAKTLKITSGKAAFLGMQERVERGEVPAIKGASDETLLKNINTARQKADEFSSWGWLAARSGRSEGFIKNGLADAGLYSPKAENIASKRSASKPKAAPKAKTPGKKTTAKKAKVKGNA